MKIAKQLGVLFFPLPGGSHWDLSLPMTKLYDQLDPEYLGSRYTNNAFIFEDVTLELACEPGKHVVKVLGQEHPGFSLSDKNFSRLLLLAAHRKVDPDIYAGGWVQKSDLKIAKNDRELHDLYGALENWTGGPLVAQDLKLLVRSSPEKDGTVRLALDPANITVDSSVQGFRPLQKPGTSARSKDSQRSGQKQYDKDMSKAAKAAFDMVKQAIEILKK